MATVSSHILDSVSGKSAAGIRCQLFQLSPGAQSQLLFDVIADHEGRISETMIVGDDQLDCEYELVMFAAEYFQVQTAVVPMVVIRFIIDDAQKRYHLPVMLSPHSYSTWWSQ